MSKSVLVSGSLAYDRILDFPGLFREHFLADKLHAISVSFRVAPPSVEFGGTAGNVAYSLSLLGESPEIASTAGNDFDTYQTYLRSHGISMDTIEIAADLPTSSAFIITDKEDNQIAAFSAAAGELPYKRVLDPERYGAAIISANTKADMLSIPDFSRAHGIPFFFDPGQEVSTLSAQELEHCIRDAKVVFTNDYEFALLKSKSGLDEAGILTRASALVVTLGAEGSRLITKEGEERIPAVRVEHVVDPTGAGDAYRAGFLAGFMRGLPLSTCAKMGAVVGAYAVEVYGTQNHRFTMDEFKRRYEAAYNDSLPVS